MLSSITTRKARTYKNFELNSFNGQGIKLKYTNGCYSQRTVPTKCGNVKKVKSDVLFTPFPHLKQHMRMF